MKRNCHSTKWLYTNLYRTGNYTIKVNNRSARTRCEICSKLTIKTPERGHWRRSGVFTVNFKYILHLVLVFLLLTLSRQMPARYDLQLLPVWQQRQKLRLLFLSDNCSIWRYNCTKHKTVERILTDWSRAYHRFPWLLNFFVVLLIRPTNHLCHHQ